MLDSEVVTCKTVPLHDLSNDAQIRLNHILHRLSTAPTSSISGSASPRAQKQRRKWLEDLIQTDLFSPLLPSLPHTHYVPWVLTIVHSLCFVIHTTGGSWRMCAPHFLSMRDSFKLWMYVVRDWLGTISRLLPRTYSLLKKKKNCQLPIWSTKSCVIHLYFIVLRFWPNCSRSILEGEVLEIPFILSNSVDYYLCFMLRIFFVERLQKKNNYRFKFP